MKALRWGLDQLGQHLRHRGAAYGVLLISLFLTALAYYYVSQNVEAQNRARFDDTTQVIQEAIERRTRAYIDAMFGARGLFYASESVTRGEWDNYVEGIEPNTRFEGLQALSYAEQVEPEEREIYARRAREENLPALQPDLIPGGERSTYFPITYTGPLEKANQSRLNYNFYAEAAHSEAMDLARDTGKPRATRKVYVLTEAPPNSDADLALQPGFVVYLPIYQEGEPLGTTAERRRALQGFVVGSFINDKLLDGIFEGSFDPAIDFEVYDGADVRSSPLLYDNDGIKRAGEKGDNPLFAKNGRLETAGREWSLYFATLPRFEKGTESNLPLFVLASGTSVSLLLFGITSMLVRSRTLAEHASKDLEEANKELEAYSSEAETRYQTLVEQTPAITYVQEPLESSNPKAVTYVSPQYDVTEQKREAQERERIEQELRIARLIQQTLLPKTLPELSGYDIAAYYQPAREVGGDFYDFLRLQDGCLGLVMGDATGKGMPAALVMAAARSMLRAVAQSSDSPGEVLERANDALVADIPPNMFVTCFYAVLDPETGRLRYANAGHDLPYLRRGADVEEPRARGMPLGLMPGMEYEQKELVLEAGNSVFFYSDGLVEAHDREGEMFGFPRLRRLIAANSVGGGEELVNFLLEELYSFAGQGWEQEDDITLTTLYRSAR